MTTCTSARNTRNSSFGNVMSLALLLAILVITVVISQNSSAEINATITSSADSIDRTDTISLYGNATGGDVDEENLTTEFEYLVYRNSSTTPISNYTISGTEGGVWFTDISANGRFFVAADHYVSNSQGKIKIDFFDIYLDEMVWTVIIFAEVYELDLSDDGTRLAIATGDGEDKWKNRVIVYDTNAYLLGDRT